MVAIDNKIEQAMVSRSLLSSLGVCGGGPRMAFLWDDVKEQRPSLCPQRGLFLLSSSSSIGGGDEKGTFLGSWHKGPL